jgi:hypothetical protein
MASIYAWMNPMNWSPIRNFLVTVLPKLLPKEEHESLLHLSKRGLAAAYDEDEYEYPMELIKESNPDYEGR